MLGLVVAEHLYRDDPSMPEGELAMARAAVVSTEALAQVAADLDLGRELRLGKGEDATGGRAKRSILADAMEAVFGAVFLDGGLDAARGVILPLLADRLAGAVADPGDTDHKTRLQEACGPAVRAGAALRRVGHRAGPPAGVHRRRPHRAARSGVGAPAAPRRRPSRRRPKAGLPLR